MELPKVAYCNIRSPPDKITFLWPAIPLLRFKQKLPPQPGRLRITIATLNVKRLEERGNAKYIIVYYLTAYI
jgi:hypothetical protein